jgi:hypothetical protein
MQTASSIFQCAWPLARAATFFSGRCLTEECDRTVPLALPIGFAPLGLAGGPAIAGL